MTSGNSASRGHSDSPFLVGLAWFTVVIVSSGRYHALTDAFKCAPCRSRVSRGNPPDQATRDARSPKKGAPNGSQGAGSYAVLPMPGLWPYELQRSGALFD